STTTPLRLALARMTSTASGRMSVATTVAPAFAARTAARPSPAPISRTRSPGRTARLRQKRSEPALGGCTASGTRKTQPRQVKRWTPASLLAKDATEVEPERFLELSARARGGLRVLELVDVELEGNPLALHTVELGRQAAALVRFGEDQLRTLEGAVVRRELLHGLDQDPLDLLGLGRRHGRERRGQADVAHQGTRYCVMSTSVESLKYRFQPSGYTHASVALPLMYGQYRRAGFSLSASCVVRAMGGPRRIRTCSLVCPTDACFKNRNVLTSVELAASGWACKYCEIRTSRWLSQ